MDDRQQRQVISDESLDRELVALLDAEVSTGFVARVRERVNGQPLSRRSWLADRWIAVAALIVVMITGAALWFKRPAPAVAADQPSLSRVVEAVVEPSPVRTDDAVATAPPQRSVEVLISPTESAIIQRLLIAARDARLTPGVSPADEPSSLDPPMPIVIEPITVAPLVTADIEVGAQQ